MIKINIILLTQFLLSICYSQVNRIPFCYVLNQYSDKKIELFENGDTSKIFRWLNEETHESICFYPNSDTLHYETEICINKRCEKFEHTKYETGQIASRYHRLDSLNGQVFSETLNLDKKGDTIYYSFVQNNKIEGRQIEEMHGYNGDTLKLITYYKNGVLIDVINVDFIYVNNKFDIISKEEWFKYKPGAICVEDFGEKLIIDGKPVTFYICCDAISKRKMHYRWQKKMIKEYGNKKYS